MKAVLALAFAVAATFTATAQAHSTETVALKKTALGMILVDGRGRTLYLFEKDRNGTSMCNTACRAYWPALTSRGMPRAGAGVRQSLLGLNRARQVTYAGHPLYTFVGDTHAGQTSGEGLHNFGAGWYAVSTGGKKIESAPATGGYGY